MKFLGTAAILGALAAVVPVHAHAEGKADFFARLTSLCGARFEGASVFPREAGDAFAGKKLVAHIATCTADEVRVPFTVGADRSRTWIFTKSAAGLELKHDHRHADGTPDEQTMYGGMANDQGSADVQSFEADAYTAKLIPAASTNVWTVTLAPDGKSISYHLARDGKPRFKAELARTAN
ncbi:hypothetical protein HHL21_00950 [Massilia sp. RP-1-19]|uniref:Secreted protein n=1 Tax=Massilia polaris TaxID=2728846 RepID=A0A848HI03_9BURK|nr:hypothetical protein [Massilia polaris]NML59681.1 hypothetical protein [Massilia polaris]